MAKHLQKELIELLDIQVEKALKKGWKIIRHCSFNFAGTPYVFEDKEGYTHEIGWDTVYSDSPYFDAPYQVKLLVDGRSRKSFFVSAPLGDYDDRLEEIYFDTKKEAKDIYHLRNNRRNEHIHNQSLPLNRFELTDSKKAMLKGMINTKTGEPLDLNHKIFLKHDYNEQSYTISDDSVFGEDYFTKKFYLPKIK